MTHRPKKITAVLLAALCLALFPAAAQTGKTAPGKPANTSAFEQTEEMRVIANLTTSMLTKMHYVKRDISHANSQKLLDSYLKTLDPLKLYFTQDQVDYWKLRQHTLLPSLAATGDVSLAFAIFNEYLRNLEEYEKFVNSRNFSDADFKTGELYEFDRTKAPWAKKQTGAPCDLGQKTEKRPHRHHASGPHQSGRTEKREKSRARRTETADRTHTQTRQPVCPVQ